MFHLIIWSKDRACQLDLLLRSIQWCGIKPYVSVIYKSSTDEFEKGYDLVNKKYNTFDSNFALINQNLYLSKSFNSATMAEVHSYSNLEYWENIGFCTDDTVFYRKFPANPTSFPLLKYNESFSFRLGLNTLLQDYSVGSIQPPLNRYINGGETISWNPQEYHPLNNYGYPYSLDLHIYNRSNIQDCLEEFTFKNTNELEGGLSHRRSRITTMTAFKKSLAVNIPMNNMSGMTLSGQTTSCAKSTEELNEAFLDGYIIDFDELLQSMRNGDAVVGCHQEFPITLTKN